MVEMGLVSLHSVLAFRRILKREGHHLNDGERQHAIVWRDRARTKLREALVHNHDAWTFYSLCSASTQLGDALASKIGQLAFGVAVQHLA